MPTTSTFHQFLQTIATNLRAACVSKNLSIAAVAKAIKTSPATLRRIEQGEHNLRIELLGRLCTFYNLSAGEVATEALRSNITKDTNPPTPDASAGKEKTQRSTKEILLCATLCAFPLCSLWLWIPA